MKNSTRRDIVTIAFGGMIAIGAIILLFAAMQSIGFAGIINDKYLTDDGLPYNEMENATYTISLKEIHAINEHNLWLVTIGLVTLGCGYVSYIIGMIMVPSKKEEHIANCEYEITKASDTVEYCPVCGIKLKDCKKK